MMSWRETVSGCGHALVERPKDEAGAVEGRHRLGCGGSKKTFQPQMNADARK
jgi:hypothetical protein